MWALEAQQLLPAPLCLTPALAPSAICTAGAREHRYRPASSCHGRSSRRYAGFSALRFVLDIIAAVRLACASDANGVGPIASKVRGARVAGIMAAASRVASEIPRPQVCATRGNERIRRQKARAARAP